MGGGEYYKRLYKGDAKNRDYTLESKIVSGKTGI